MPFKKHNTRHQQSKSQHDLKQIVHQPTDIVLAKVKGYPPWPAMIIPTEIIPPNVLKTNSHVYVDENENGNEDDEQHDDNYIIYSKILKFKKYLTPQEVYCVKFFKDDSYIWVKYDDLQPLTLRECQDWLTENQSSGKHKRLIPAYEMACDGFKGNGIDVWEFVEYGSKNRKTNADDEEYTEEENSSGSTRSGRSTRTGRKKRGLSPERPTRISIRQRHLREVKPEEEEVQDEEEVEEKPRATKKRNTRSTGKKVKEVEVKKSIATPAPKKKIKVEKKPVPPKPVIEKYHYEDDEDWTIVGMGPQNYTVTSKISSLVTKLSQKKNLEKHNETRLDLVDRLLSINKLLFAIFTGSPQKDEYEILLDELDIVLAMNGSKNEFISTIRNNNELLVNFRILFNLKLDDLQKYDLYDNFQQVFDSIYDCSFIPDLVPWSRDMTVVDQGRVDDTSVEQNESTATTEKVEGKHITSETN